MKITIKTKREEIINDLSIDDLKVIFDKIDISSNNFLSSEFIVTLIVSNATTLAVGLLSAWLKEIISSSNEVKLNNRKLKKADSAEIEKIVKNIIEKELKKTKKTVHNTRYKKLPE
ncbi:hypothetical protein [uncultured Acetobacteroides sp.]|uniref:hypothetical protein n=1 Tax=uncultured Acetobacteroides sp. TaxID=1760811 RepID=UPI0029F4B1FA|nr:hypothetical protein [uncultured Acetobacteroides sp.]